MRQWSRKWPRRVRPGPTASHLTQDLLPGKEGLDGSSPSEGFAKTLQNAAFSFLANLQNVQCDAGMEHILEVPDSEQTLISLHLPILSRSSSSDQRAFSIRLEESGEFWNTG